VCALGDAKVRINISNPIHYEEPTVGSCAVSGLHRHGHSWRLIRVELGQGKEACNITLTNKLGINRPYYTRNFTVTCNNNTRSLVIKCAVMTIKDGITQLQVDGKLIH